MSEEIKRAVTELHDCIRACHEVPDPKPGELSRLRAEVSRLNGIVADMCNESRELRAALATETRAVERLAEHIAQESMDFGCSQNFGHNECNNDAQDTENNCAACWAAWARQKEVPRG